MLHYDVTGGFLLGRGAPCVVVVPGRVLLLVGSGLAAICFPSPRWAQEVLALFF